jgi:outer membrane beta-barrel protein
MKHVATCATAALCAALILPRPAHAQLQFAGDVPQIYSVQLREHRFTHAVQLGSAVLPLDAFYVGLAAYGSYTYHYDDLWAWEVLNGFYSYNFDTGLRSELAAAGVQPSLDSLQRVRFMLSTNLVFKPMFGKLSLFNRSVLEAETLFSAGLGGMQLSQSKGTATGQPDVLFRPAFNVGIGFHFWVTKGISIRFDIRDYLVFMSTSSPVPSSVLMILLSGSIGFVVPTVDPVSAPVGGGRG